MIINTNIALKDLAGKNLTGPEGKDFTLGEALSSIIIASKEGGKMKLFLLGKKMFEGGKVEVDEADLSLIKNAVKTTDIYTNALVPGQCEIILDGIKEVTEKKK